MTNLENITKPEERELVVAFFDLTHYKKFAQTLSSKRMFDFIAGYYEFVGDIMERDDGIVVKFIGDAGLIVYPADNADPAVCNLKELKDNGDNWLSSHGADCQQIIKAHIGPAMCGYVGTKRTKRFDVFGNTVTKAALVQSDGFAVTPQLFQKLTAKTQTMFKEHKSTITFRPAEKN